MEVEFDVEVLRFGTLYTAGEGREKGRKEGRDRKVIKIRTHGGHCAR